MANTPFPTGARCLKTWTSLLLLGASLSWGAASSAVITLAMPIGARQMAMGESGTALAEDAFAVWWNPAGLAVGPVADEWTVSMPHPKDGQIRGLSSKEKRGFLGSAEVWAGADGGLWHFKDNTWRDWWSVSLEEGQTLRGALKRFVGGEEGIDTLLVQLRAFNGISSVHKLRKNETYEEEGVESHAAGLCKRHLGIESHDESSCYGYQDGTNVNCIPDVSQAFTETCYLVGIYDDDVGHGKECGKAGEDLSPYG